MTIKTVEVFGVWMEYLLTVRDPDGEPSEN